MRYTLTFCKICANIFTSYMKNYYEIIGVDVGADFSEIKSAYLVKIKEYHPDIYVGDKSFAVEKTAELNEAYNTLKDEELRKEYDLKNNFNQNISHNENTKTKEKNVNQEQEDDANLFKDFSGKIKTFFKGLKDDLSNFKKSHKKQKVSKKNNVKNTHKNNNNNKNENNSNINTNTEKDVKNTENIIDKKDNIKRKITIWILIFIVIILILLSIYVF